MKDCSSEYYKGVPLINDCSLVLLVPDDSIPKLDFSYPSLPYSSMQALTTVFLCMLFRLQDMDALVPAVLRSLTGKHEETLVPMGM